MRLASAVLLPLLISAQDASTVEFFETRIRPLLAEKCYACHGAKLASGNLRLDSRDAIRKGGNRGPAVVPGEIPLSLIPRAISYRESDLKMPPAGRLTDQQIDDLNSWIRAGAADPRTNVAAPTAVSKLWSLEPYREHPLPKTANQAWPRTWIDRFVLARLEAAKLAPAPETARRTWIRRVTFDLTGLPPSPTDVEQFLADLSAQAYERVVERLLASPHYGERWGRHWLDLARYAETDGHEFDREKLNAWRYRDYVIRAFNDDVPYDQFVREQIAGDLIPSPRRGPGGTAESPLGTAFFALYEERNAADDLGEVRAEKLDNQIDTFGKTFLGLTIACARCHDHKFDPIPTRDYYALGGVLGSKQVIQAALDAPRDQRALFERMASIQARIEEAKPRGFAGDLAEAVKQYVKPVPPDVRQPLPLQGLAADIQNAAREPDHLLYPVARLAKPKPSEENQSFAERLGIVRGELAEWNQSAAKGNPRDVEVRMDGWRADGPAFEVSLAIPALTGFLTSKTFRVDRKYLHVRLAGTFDNTSRRQPGEVRLSLVGDGRDAGFTPDPSGRFVWRTSRMGKMFGELVYFEMSDRTRTGYIKVDRIVFSDNREPPALGRAVDPRVIELAGRDFADMDAFLSAWQSLVPAALPGPPAGDLAGLRKEMEILARQLDDPTFGLISAEDTARNLPQLKAGNHRSPGTEVPRGFLSALNGGTFNHGSGREELAAALTARANPLTARVFVNRVWKHHFGEGLVRTTDNFGSTGERPSNPELLDTLAARFAASGWRVKDLHRTIVLSAAYRQSNDVAPAAAQADPDNRLLHHMPVRRLEAEAIRDSMLAVSGNLEPKSYGPPVPPHISEYQDGRGKPPTGPVDGARRRSVYIGIRRNFLPPLFVAFDYPPTVTTVGRRGAATVPSQALIMLNNEFVQSQAAVWARNAAAAHAGAGPRLQAMFAAAFGRPAEAGEIDESLTFLAAQEKQYKEGGAARAWADLAHSLFNSKEFIFIP